MLWLQHLCIFFFLFVFIDIEYSERTAKYNQLLRIEEELGAAAKYPGMSFRKPGWMA
jgi:Enolase, C-terminal TIM barrel domain